MSDSRSCPQCGSPIAEDSADRYCISCLQQAALDSPHASPSVFAPTRSSPVSGGLGFIPPPPEELQGQFPQFEVLELLGKGGMGAVYKARQKSLDRLVAVKILPTEVGAQPEFAERFTREARALAKLSHPHIVTVYDFGHTSAGQFYFLMEYIDGQTLRQAMQGRRPAPGEATAIVSQVCEALQFAHDAGIVHRDIKPENVLIDRGGRVRIADFGLARLVGHDSDQERLTMTRQVMGTLRYMAPEQIEGAADIDHRADIYALGVVFYELLTGTLPLGRFRAPSEKQPGDSRLDRIVLRMLEREPEDRYQRAGEARRDLDSLTTISPASVATAAHPLALVAAPQSEPTVISEAVATGRQWFDRNRSTLRWFGSRGLIVAVVMAGLSVVTGILSWIGDSQGIGSVSMIGPLLIVLGFFATLIWGVRRFTSWVLSRQLALGAGIFACLAGAAMVPLTWVEVTYPSEPSVLGRGYHSWQGIAIAAVFLAPLIVMYVGSTQLPRKILPSLHLACGLIAAGLLYSTVFWAWETPTPVPLWMAQRIDAAQRQGVIQEITVVSPFWMATVCSGLLVLVALNGFRRLVRAGSPATGDDSRSRVPPPPSAAQFRTETQAIDRSSTFPPG